MRFLAPGPVVMFVKVRYHGTRARKAQWKVESRGNGLLRGNMSSAIEPCLCLEIKARQFASLTKPCTLCHTRNSSYLPQMITFLPWEPWTIQTLAEPWSVLISAPDFEQGAVTDIKVLQLSNKQQIHHFSNTSHAENDCSLHQFHKHKHRVP